MTICRPQGARAVRRTEMRVGGLVTPEGNFLE